MTIFSINPLSGNVGTNVTITANLTTTNGRYNVTFDGVFQVFGNAAGNNVNVNFTVPESTFGNHNVTVVDVNTSDTATGNFSVSTTYSLNVSTPTPPAQLQEGELVPLSVSVTGGNSSGTIAAAITAQTPATSITEQLNISTSALGSGQVTLNYPGNFSGANTNYVGNYTVSLTSSDLTVFFANSTFFVGLTNSTEYHRTQAVNIKAVYAQNENVTLTVSGSYGSDSVNLTADSAGLIDYSNWTVPVSASVGTYNVNVVPLNVSDLKVPPDTQNFTVPGFAFNVTAKNLAGDLVPNVDVRAFEHGASVSNQTTSSDGLAVLMLELGNYTLKGYSEGVDVAENGEFAVTGTEAVDLVCNLTNLNVQVVGVVNGAEIGIPEVGIYLTPENLTLTTDITGNVVAHSLLPNATYYLNASRYNTPLYPNVTKIASLLVNESLVQVFNETIVCPSYTLQVSAFKADGQGLDNAAVEIKESLGGIHYDGTTNSSGIVVFNATFGRYDVEVHDSAGRELNSTSVDLFQDQNVALHCDLFGLSINVTVTDYFGQPFPNINITLQGTNITLQGNGFESISKMTQANGMVTFDNLVGDSFGISVYLSGGGQPMVIESILVDGSTTVPIKINRYVLLAGFLVETSQLAIAVIIVLSLLLVLSLEVYRRRRNKSRKIDN